jgi:hypothetical protein
VLPGEENCLLFFGPLSNLISQISEIIWQHCPMLMEKSQAPAADM